VIVTLSFVVSVVNSNVVAEAVLANAIRADAAIAARPSIFRYFM
jgi:hypothetical protein